MTTTSRTCESPVCRAQVLPLLFQMGQLITSSKDLAQSLNVLLQIMERQMNVVRGMVNLFDRRTGTIFIHESLGLSDEEAAKGVYALGEGITGKVVETGQAMLVKRISEEPGFLNRTGSRDRSQEGDLSFLCVPILRGQKVLGTISAERRYDNPGKLQQDMELLTIIASMIAQEVELFLMTTELQEAEQARYKPANILGNSQPMRQVYALMAKIAKAKTTVLILGESGVGKELVANALHYSSAVATGPFVKFNCAALPESLIESELFGHEKGSFTGAAGQRQGRFEDADGGTIFLDEIGELSLPLQAKLLRVLQEKTFERVGGNKPIKVDIRILTATNRDLPAMVAEGKFRGDLYYRLNVFPITIPPLKDRGSDIITLADAFVAKFSAENGKEVKRISTPALELLLRYPWPGNVRELENVIERAVILSDGDSIHAYDLPPSLQSSGVGQESEKGSLQLRLDAMEYEMLVEALTRTRGNMTEAGLQLGLSKRMMGLRMTKFGLDFTQFRAKTGLPTTTGSPPPTPRTR